MTVTSDVALGFAPVRVEDGREVRLVMQELVLKGAILPIGARLTVEHVFQSAEKKPVEVVYAFMLPRDASLRQFRIVGEDFSVASELRPVKEAEKEYEAALESGHLASLAKTYRDGVVNLTVGNIRPDERVSVSLELLAGVEFRDDGLRFRFPFALAPGYHQKARMVEAEPKRGEIELPEDEFGDVILPTWRDDSGALHRVGFDLELRMPWAVAEVSSPSHPIRVRQKSPLSARVQLASSADAPNRDVIIDVRCEGEAASTLTGLDQTGRGRFACVIPSRRFGEPTGGPRSVVFVLDRSGSMEGRPIIEARNALKACLGALGPEDEFGIVAFDNEVEEYQPKLVKGAAENRREAEDFLSRIDSRGGTELVAGLKAGLRLLGSKGGDLFLLTDGQVYGTEDILAQVRQFETRVHCLGIGSASQDRFLSLLSSKSGGVCRFVTPRERVDMAALELFAQVQQPVARAVEHRVEGLADARIEPAPLTEIFAGSPCVLVGSCSGPGDGAIVVSWAGQGATREWRVPVTVSDNPIGETLKQLQGARLITNMETELSLVGENTAADRRNHKRLFRKLEELSLEYGLSSKAAALVAVVKRAGDVPGQIPEVHIVPVGMPPDTAFDAYFHGVCACPATSRASILYQLPGKKKYVKPAPSRASRLSPPLPPPPPPLPAFSPADAAEVAEGDALVDLAAHIEPDGGMPGQTPAQRAAHTIAALLAFLEHGHTFRRGPFAAHVRRLVDFLTRLDRSTLSPEQTQDIDTVLSLARGKKRVPGRIPAPDHGAWVDLEKEGVTGPRSWLTLGTSAFLLQLDDTILWKTIREALGKG